MTLKTHRLRTVEQVRAFLDGTGELDVKSVERAAAYDFITETLNRLGYPEALRGAPPGALSGAPVQRRAARTVRRRIRVSIPRTSSRGGARPG